MRCKTCHYDLSNLTPTESGEHRCPECGGAFDPNDSNTFDTTRSQMQRARMTRAAKALLVGLGAFLLTFAINFHLVSTDTTYVPDAASSTSEWGLLFQVLLAAYRSAFTCALILPVILVLFAIYLLASKPRSA